MSIDLLLKPFQNFGIHLGLERIQTLLADLGNPHQSIPIIHVGGTNGKGSVCAYLSSILTEAGYKAGLYTSPHLIDWTERICLNNQPISENQLIDIVITIKNIIDSYSESPTQFEVITAAAWVYFAQQKVDIAVIEVGLGGRLDATNVCEQSLVSIITSISREHWQVLGDTIELIAKEKAGIFKPGCPTIIGTVSREVELVFKARIQQLNCPSIWVKPAIYIQDNWAKYQDIEYPLPLLGQMQLSNSALAIETVKFLQQKGWNIPLTAIQNGMKKTQWLGRLQWVQWQNTSILVDGAHNPAAAEMLRNYVDTFGKSIIWVMGILSTKEHDKIFQFLLQPQDSLYLVAVPNHNSANPQELVKLAVTICPNLVAIKTFETVFDALDKAIKNLPSEQLIVLCGSLYLVGHFLGSLQSNNTTLNDR
ncbi:folylpolyglutamate synthase/dihydrofolate synthase family protein [Crocosphaera sp. UHCC 0190]|uniref:bifunctional folylpolyglutamate synthase/dihydrofolate synthase n=1 Tax=Crocosphaera sp. UHCC 0190 TaxID=3110246 RepID=UPI002B202731|nr:folylpolyglutamate synthase/dihydrofolate synthase family protein [Crocosphaera sp. UHCC 0190]MEA5511657.1 folylpolyglutamate synthase/dihydrofolate synthase family protein [Crocosphaera sp. UHCC 0190]